MKATISADVANASGSVCGNGKSGSRTDQFGNWNFSPSQRSLRQRSAIRCRSSTRCATPRCLRLWLIVSPAWPPPMISVFMCSIGIAMNLTCEFACGSAVPGRSCRGAHDPAPECGEIALPSLEAAIDQIPAHAFWHRQCKWRNQPTGGDVVVDIGPNAHRNTQPVDGGLQRLAVKLKLQPPCRHARNGGGLEPQRPVVGRVSDAEQARSFQVAGAFQPYRQ